MIPALTKTPRALGQLQFSLRCIRYLKPLSSPGPDQLSKKSMKFIKNNYSLNDFKQVYFKLWHAYVSTLVIGPSFNQLDPNAAKESRAVESELTLDNNLNHFAQ